MLRYLFITCVTRTTIIWGTVPEIQSEKHIFFLILGHFLSFTQLLTPKIKLWKKYKKTPGNIIFLHMCTMNEDHMMYGSWDIRQDGYNFWSFWTIFFLLTPPPPLTTQKIKFWKNENNSWRYHYVTLLCHWWQSYDVWFLRYWARQIIFWSFWTILCLFTPLKPENQNFGKMKNAGRYHHFTVVYHKLQSYDVWLLRYEVQ